MIPDHLHNSLKNACRMCIIAGNSVGDIRIPAWAITFGCSEEHVRLMWDHELTKLSQLPSNALESQDD